MVCQERRPCRGARRLSFSVRVHLMVRFTRNHKAVPVGPPDAARLPQFCPSGCSPRRVVTDRLTSLRLLLIARRTVTSASTAFGLTGTTGCPACPDAYHMMVGTTGIDRAVERTAQVMA